MTDVTTSVVMAARDAASNLGATIESLLGQSDPDFELIIVDDGSRDGTGDLIARYGASDRRIRLIGQPESTGLTRALIAGCAAARGRFIARQDAGDLSHTRRLERQRACLEADASLSFVSCWTEFVGPELEPLYVARGSGAAARPMSIIDSSQANGVVDGPTCHPSVVWRRQHYEGAGGYRPEFYFGQDWDLWYRLAALGKFQVIPEVLYTARVTPDSISTGWRPAQQQLARLSHAAFLARDRGESEAALLETAALIRPAGGPAPIRRAEGLYFIGEVLRRNKDRRARKYFWRAMQERELFFKAWLRLVQTAFR